MNRDSIATPRDYPIPEEHIRDNSDNLLAILLIDRVLKFLNFKIVSNLASPSSIVYVVANRNSGGGYLNQEGRLNSNRTFFQTKEDAVRVCLEYFINHT